MEKLIHQALTSSDGPFQGKRITKIIPVSGGCIHQAWHIELENGQEIFVKSSDIKGFDMLKFEADGLNHLRKFANKEFITIPKPLILQRINKISILIMPWLELTNDNDFNLGQGLALLHKNSAQQKQRRFGWNKQGFIGTNLQTEGWENNWGDCFVNLRLIPQLKLSKQWGLNYLEYKELLLKITKYLNYHSPDSCLVHGDLWSGNCASLKNGKGVIFDPACWWADREVDIAMTRMFGGFSNMFYEGYNNVWPLEKESKDRLNIYNLYHALNHANLFNGSYKQNCINIINYLRNRFKA